LNVQLAVGLEGVLRVLLEAGLVLDLEAEAEEQTLVVVLDRFG